MYKYISTILLAVISIALILLCLRSCKKDHVYNDETSHIKTEIVELKKQPRHILKVAEDKKASHIRQPVKERIAKIKSVAPNVVITDSTFTAGVELADTIEFLKVDLQASKEIISALDSVILLQEKVIMIDSLNIQLLNRENENKAIKINSLKRINIFLVGTAIALTATLILLIR